MAKNLTPYSAVVTINGKQLKRQVYLKEDVDSKIEEIRKLILKIPSKEQQNV